MSLGWLRRFQAIVFDMDGVLVDSEPLHLEALNRVLAEEGHQIDARANLEFVGTTLEYTWTTLVERLGLNGRLEDYYRLYDEAVLAVLRAAPLEPLPGVQPLLAALRRAGRRIGLATQSRRDWAEATLRGLGLWGAFDAIVTGEMVTRGKPDPEIYQRTCALLGARPPRCLAIEDSVPGSRAARAAGMSVVGVRGAYTGPALESEVDLVVDRLDALLDLSDPWGPRPSAGAEGIAKGAEQPGERSPDPT